MIRVVALAFIFLTRIPIPMPFKPSSKDWGRSVFFFPLVGLVIGLLMASLYALLQLHPIDSGVMAVLLLVVWIVTTGGLHLDGLADAADAWIGGFGDREKSLAIMKDPHSGPAAIVVMIVILLAKFAALRVVVESNTWEILVWVPVLGRAAIVFMLLTTPYVRSQGIGVAYADYLPQRACSLLLLGIIAVTIWLLGWKGVALLSLLGIGLVSLRCLLLKRLGGATGDTLGATCELSEASALIILIV